MMASHLSKSSFQLPRVRPSQRMCVQSPRIGWLRDKIATWIPRSTKNEASEIPRNPLPPAITTFLPIFSRYSFHEITASSEQIQRVRHFVGGCKANCRWQRCCRLPLIPFLRCISGVAHFRRKYLLASACFRPVSTTQLY